MSESLRLAHLDYDVEDQVATIRLNRPDKRNTFSKQMAVDIAEAMSAAERDSGGVAALAIAQSRKPVVGAIEGSAVGIGATLTLPMDVRVLGESTRRIRVQPSGAGARGGLVVVPAAGGLARQGHGDGAGYRARDRRSHRAGLGVPGPPDDLAEGISSFFDKRDPAFPMTVPADLPDVVDRPAQRPADL